MLRSVRMCLFGTMNAYLNADELKGLRSEEMSCARDSFGIGEVVEAVCRDPALVILFNPGIAVLQ